MLKYIVATALFCFQLTFAQESFQHLYLAIAGPAPGPSILGHAFLVFTHRPEVFINAKAYQFNLDATESDQYNNLDEFLGKGKRFFLSQENALYFIRYYNSEDRPVLLFKIKIAASDIDKIHGELEKEIKLREEIVFTDYDFKTNNCLTKIISILNKYLSPKLPSLDSQLINFPTDFIKSAPYFIVGLLKGHPLIGPNPIIFSPIVYDQVIAVDMLNKEIDEWHKLCPWDSLEKLWAQRIMARAKWRETNSFLTFLSSKYQKCSKSETHYINILDIIYGLTLSNDSRKLVGSFYP